MNYFRQLFFSILMLGIVGTTFAQEPVIKNSLWLRTNYNWATFITRDPSMPADGSTQMPYNKGIGIGLSDYYRIASRWQLESNVSYQKKGFSDIVDIGNIIGEVSDITFVNNFHFVDWAEVVWFTPIRTPNVQFNMGAGLGIGALLSYKKGSDFWLLNSNPTYAAFLNSIPKTIAPFVFLGIQLKIKNNFIIGFDQKNDLGYFIKESSYEAKNWVWSLSLSYRIMNLVK